MTYFAYQSPTIISLLDEVPNFLDKLPVDTYALKFDMKMGIYLERIGHFEMPPRLYGTIEQTRDRAIRTFETRKGITGILLTGEKGSGKTLLAKSIATKLREEQGISTIVVNMPITGDDFNIFLQKIGQPLCLIFDEFEKVYNRPELQNGLLTLLDGVYPMKLVAMLTANDSTKMISPLIDRPSRVFYKIDYRGLEYSFVVEYAEANLKNQAHVGDVSRLALVTELNFDQLQALIEEMNRYDETVAEAVQLLNLSIDGNSQSMRVIKMSKNGVAMPESVWRSRMFYDNILNLQPSNDEGDDYERTFAFGYWDKPPQGEDAITGREIHKTRKSDDENDVWTVFSEEIMDSNMDLPMSKGNPRVLTFKGDETKIDVNRAGQITLKNKEGDEVVLERFLKSYYKAF